MKQLLLICAVVMGQSVLAADKKPGRVPGAKAPVAVVAPGKTFAWTANVNQQSLDVLYRGKPYTLVQKVFGKPDKTEGSWWGYTGMNITDGQGTKYSTAWFGFTNGVVQQVRFDK